MFGVHSYVFCDFGDEFTVTDPDGLEPQEAHIAWISKVSWTIKTNKRIRFFFYMHEALYAGSGFVYDENNRVSLVRVCVPAGVCGGGLFCVREMWDGCVWGGVCVGDVGCGGCVCEGCVCVCQLHLLRSVRAF